MKRKLLITTIIIISAAAAFALRLYLQTEARRGLELARFMPNGALAYVEFRALDRLLGRWLSSDAHMQYFESANWTQFQRSRLYLKLEQRLEPIEAALGFEITEDRLQAIVGARSALGIYDIGQLEALFITEMTRERALASELFRQRRTFQERSFDGFAYYVREAVSSENQRKVIGGFAFAQGKLFVASSESLLRRALTNTRTQSEDRLSQQTARMTDALSDFTSHDITIWLDQERLNADRYFKNYWIHRNGSELANIESVLIDLELDGDLFRERRWLALSEAAPENTSPLTSLAEMLRFVPPTAHWLAAERVRDVNELSRLTNAVILGDLPSPSFLPSSYGTSYDEESYETSYEAATDDRFNKDIDDPTSISDARRGRAQPATSPSDDDFIPRLSAVLQPAEPTEFISVGEAVIDDNGLFVYFKRALIAKLARPQAFQASVFEDLIRKEFASRYVVQGVPNQLTWSATGAIHSLSQALLDRGGAYALVGDYLILTNGADYGNRLVEGYRAARVPSGPSEFPSPDHFAQVRVRQGSAAYKHVMGMLAPSVSTTDIDTDTDAVIDLFSENIVSLIQIAPDLEHVTLERVYAAPFIREIAVYRFD